MPHETDGQRYIMRLPAPMSRNICHGVPLAPKINYELSGCLRERRCLICTKKSRLSLTAAESLPISRCSGVKEGEVDREREREREEKTCGIINLSAKRPRTSVASLWISQMRPWFSSGIPWRYGRRLSLVSRVICPSLSILGRFSTCSMRRN